MQLNAVVILKSTNEYYQKIISKSGLKMDLYPAMLLVVVSCQVIAVMSVVLHDPYNPYSYHLNNYGYL